MRARGGFDLRGEDAIRFEDGSAELSFGFSQRVAARLALQGSISFGTGFGRRIDERFAPLFDATADFTLRIGSSRVYFGLGPIARFWRVFGEAEPLRIGGGAIYELGFLLGDDRELDLVWRVQLGGFRLEGKLDLWFAETLGIGWHF